MSAVSRERLNSAASLACRNRDVQQYSTKRLFDWMIDDDVVGDGGDDGGGDFRGVVSNGFVTDFEQS